MNRGGGKKRQKKPLQELLLKSDFQGKFLILLFTNPVFKVSDKIVNIEAKNQLNSLSRTEVGIETKKFIENDEDDEDDDGWYQIKKERPFDDREQYRSQDF